MTAALVERAPRTRAERTVVTRDGVHLAVRDDHPGAAAGATVVLLHGLCLSQASWAQQVHYLRQRGGPPVRIITYDHRGHGQSSPAPMGTYRVAQLAADLAAVLDDAQVDTPLILAGHSMGGMAALAYLAARSGPITPAGLVLVATAAGQLCQRGLGRLLATPLTGALYHVATHAPDHLLRSLARPVCATVGRYAHCGGDERATLTALTARVIAGTPITTAVGYLPGLRCYDTYAALAAITAATVVVSGGADPLTPAGHAHDLVQAIPGAEHIHLPGAGHMLPTEAPQAVNDALSRVLTHAKRPRALR
jgi:pimeloyl-ACP methyl ester carboxylesterase